MLTSIDQQQLRYLRYCQFIEQIDIQLDDKQLEKMIDLLSSQDKNKSLIDIQKKQDKLDSLFYENAKYKLEPLIERDLLCKQQQKKILQKQKDNQVKGNIQLQVKASSEIHEFI